MWLFKMRSVDSDSKTTQIVIIPKNKEQEVLLRAFKKWCLTNDQKLSQVGCSLVKDFMALHHWKSPADIAHSQASMAEYTKAEAEVKKRLNIASLMAATKYRQVQEIIKAKSIFSAWSILN